MNFPEDFVDRVKPWSRHPHFADRVRRYNNVLKTWQMVRFGSSEQRDQFLIRQRNQVQPEQIHKRRQGNYGSHARDRHLVNR
jgi:hypothetical protein